MITASHWIPKSKGKMHNRCLGEIAPPRKSPNKATSNPRYLLDSNPDFPPQSKCRMFRVNDYVIERQVK